MGCFVPTLPNGIGPANNGVPPRSPSLREGYESKGEEIP